MTVSFGRMHQTITYNTADHLPKTITSNVTNSKYFRHFDQPFTTLTLKPLHVHKAKQTHKFRSQGRNVGRGSSSSVIMQWDSPTVNPIFSLDQSMC